MPFDATQSGTKSNEALKQEHARREAAVKYLYRWSASRLARDAKLDNRTQ
jgi:hypothetical protein